MDHQAALLLIQDIFRLKQKLFKSSKVKEKLRIKLELKKNLFGDSSVGIK